MNAEFERYLRGQEVTDLLVCDRCGRPIEPGLGLIQALESRSPGVPRGLRRFAIGHKACLPPPPRPLAESTWELDPYLNRPDAVRKLAIYLAGEAPRDGSWLTVLDRLLGVPTTGSMAVAHG